VHFQWARITHKTSESRITLSSVFAGC